MDEDPQDYSDSSSCCQTSVTRDLHPEEQNDLQLDSESDTSGIYFLPLKSKKDYHSVDVENDFDDIGDCSHTFSESSIDLEQVINQKSNNGKPIRSPYLLRSRSTSPVKCIASDEISPIRTLDDHNFPKISLGLHHSQSLQRRLSIKNSLPPVRESDESIAFKMTRENVEPCSSKSSADDNKVYNTNDNQNYLNRDLGDKMKQDDQEIMEKAVKKGALVLNINFSLNCEKDKSLILNISPQYHGSNSTEEIKVQCNASTSIQTPIEDLDKTVEVSSLINEEGSQNDKMGSQTDEMGSQTDEIGSQTVDVGSQIDKMSTPSITAIEPEEILNKTTKQNKSIAPGSSKNPTNREKKDTGEKKQPRAKVAKNGNKSQTKEVNHRAKEKKKVEPKRPRVKLHKPRRSSNCNFSKRKFCRHYSTSSSSEECCCSDSTSSSSSCSCSSCCSSSS